MNYLRANVRKPEEPPAGRDDLVRYVVEWLKPLCHGAGPEDLWRAVALLVDKLEGTPEREHYWAMRAVTDWKQCREVQFGFASYVFSGTDVGVESMFTAFGRGKTIQQFLHEEKSVSPVQAAAVLEHLILTVAL